MPSRPLFVYGTLRDPDVLFAILGRDLPPAQRRAARAPGFAVLYYPDRVYPALVEVDGANAPGLLLTGLTALDLDVLDAFEGDEYARSSLTTTIDGTTLDADFYRPVITIPANATPWTLEGWTERHKTEVLGRETETAKAMREALSARHTA